ncbi:hypothetical protein NKOR_04110 [Candidatus Nitrosopumilus koreensis AR1]|uniref:Uncharacterized protein n=1 Tax=Candidatus Nitrosopumilus koreensis AR1 TaxID=1229908 RepID=K0B6E5_9ARCH|nr:MULTISPECIES: hypothetical protein [Nitrosopumilus]AFS80712.1 hypothetical protein NKOR_04110 [Candidatus Nitrosopumilus koreensis AR1]
MSLDEQVSKILENFENTSSSEIVDVLKQIQPQFKSNLTSEYLDGKIQKILDAADESEKMKQCKALTPYLDWYLQGL